MSHDDHSKESLFRHPSISRRTAIQAGGIGLLGLGMNHVAGLRDMAAEAAPRQRAKGIIYIFLSGGLTQHDSFDPKPHAPDSIRGEFFPISTRTPDLQICEHLPLLAQCSDKWAIVRSLTHPYNGHSEGHMVMLSGRTPLPRGFSGNSPKPTDWPCIASVAGRVMPRMNNLPPAAVLPEKLIHVSGRTIPGQFAGLMGAEHDPWFVEANRFRTNEYIHGAFPEYGFHRWNGSTNPPNFLFEAPRLTLEHGILERRFVNRVDLLHEMEQQRCDLDRAANIAQFDRYRQQAVSLLLDGGTYKALDVHAADPKLQERYGRNSFGWSLLMARQLIEAGCSLVQVNLGNDESWDTHEAAFRNLKNYLFPPTDKALSALIDDLDERGMLDETLIVMAGEFGRTPKVFTPKGAKSNLPGRDHWGAVQTVFFAGGGVRGGNVVGSSDRIGAYPHSDLQKPENMAATIYQSLGLPRTVVWKNKFDKPNHIYHGEPIAGLT
jgi:hypothetical protein